MIYRQEILPLLVKACPSFTGIWDEHKVFYADEENFLPYVALGEFACHLVELYKSNELSEFENVFAYIEKFHTEGEGYVKEAATIGLLEGLQNVAGNRGVNPMVFEKYLGPVSSKWWNQLNKFWNGEVEFVDEGITE